MSGLPLWWYDGCPAEIRTRKSVETATKRCFDVATALLLAMLFSPSVLVIAILVRLTSPGPILFSQWRIGKDGTFFRVHKFRTFHSAACDETGRSQTVSDDERVTSFGRFLRVTSLDEIPQLLNVLRGEMSIVGPRPHVPGMLAGGMLYDELVPYYHLRHAVRPGITGWAQANGLRGPSADPHSARERVNHDIAYIQNVSLRLDIKIIWMTLFRQVLPGRGL